MRRGLLWVLIIPLFGAALVVAQRSDATPYASASAGVSKAMELRTSEWYSTVSLTEQYPSPTLGTSSGAVAPHAWRACVDVSGGNTWFYDCETPTNLVVKMP